MKRALLTFFLLLLSSLSFPQEVKLPSNIYATEFPPESIPSGTCRESYSGYLEISEDGKIKNRDFTSQQIGDYVKKRLSEGYSLSLYPQASGRLFVFETCESQKAKVAR
jgi:hypothetical protein